MAPTIICHEEAWRYSDSLGLAFIHYTIRGWRVECPAGVYYLAHPLVGPDTVGLRIAEALMRESI